VNSRCLLSLFICFFSAAARGETTLGAPADQTETGSSCPEPPKDSVAYQCAKGVYQNFVDLIHLPGALAEAVGNGQKNLAECNANPEIKKGLLIVVEPMIDMSQWMSMTCEQVLETLRLKEPAFLRQVVSKMNEQTRLQTLLDASGSDPTRVAFLEQKIAREQLSPAEQNFYNRYVARESLVKRLTGNDIAQALNCTTLKDVLVTTCQVITEAATGGLAVRAVRTAGKGLGLGTKALAPLTPFQSAVSKFERSRKIEYYDGNQRVSSISIQPNDSFTVIIHNGKLVLGKNIAGEHGRIGAAGSHVTLMRLIGEPNPYKYYGRGGAVRFNENGTIDISGYHLEDDAHPTAYKDIQTLMEGINPDAVYRSTPDRLSTLPSL